MPAAASDGGADESPRGVLPFPLKYLGPARQVVIITARTWTSTQARLEAFENGSQGWSCVCGPYPARVGRTGMIPADRRVQGSGTTPAGTFTLTMAFGLEPDPGGLLPYAHITSPDHWWVADPGSPHYNTLRLREQGGFRPTESGRRGSERIAAHPAEYEHAVVVDFNRPSPVRTRGSGIFVRTSTGLATDGSVTVGRDALLMLLGWLDPTRHPVITIAPERSIAQY